MDLPVIFLINSSLLLLASLLPAAPYPYLSKVWQFFFDIFMSTYSNSTSLLHIDDTQDDPMIFFALSGFNFKINKFYNLIKNSINLL